MLMACKLKLITYTIFLKLSIFDLKICGGFCNYTPFYTGGKLGRKTVTISEHIRIFDCIMINYKKRTILTLITLQCVWVMRVVVGINQQSSKFRFEMPLITLNY